MKKLYIVIIIFLLPILLAAQSPGYLGRKVYLGINVNISPAGLNSVFFPGNDVKMRPSIPYFNLGIFSDLDIAVTRRSSIGFTYNLLLNSFDVKDEYVSPAKISSLGLQAHTILFKWQRHKRNDEIVAPVGFMRGWSAGVTISNVIDKNGVFANKDGEVKKGIYATVISPMLFYSFTYRNAITKRLVFTSGINLGIFSLFGGLGSFRYNPYKVEEGNGEAELKRIAQNIVYKQSIITVNLGLSYLLF